MTVQSRATLKSYFNLGDIPTETQFSDFIDSMAGRMPSILDYDGATDTEKIKAAIADNQTGRIYVPPGIYSIVEPLLIPPSIQIYADSNAEFRAMATMDAMIYNTAFSYSFTGLRLWDLKLNGNHLAQHSLSLYYILSSGLIHGIRAYNCLSDGIQMRFCMLSQLSNCDSFSNIGNGYNLLGNNAMNLHNNRSAFNSGSGYYISNDISEYNGLTYQGGVSIFGGDIESNKQHGIFIKSLQNPVLINGCWLEGNVMDGIRVDAAGAVILSNVISGTGLGDNYAIHLITGSSASINGNQLYGNDSYAQVKDEVGASSIGFLWRNWLVPFLYENSGATSAADGGTILHGMAATPTSVIAVASVSGEIVSVTAIDPNRFIVAIKKHDGTAGTTQTVYWRAKV